MFGAPAGPVGNGTWRPPPPGPRLTPASALRVRGGGELGRRREGGARAPPRGATSPPLPRSAFQPLRVSIPPSVQAEIGKLVRGSAHLVQEAAEPRRQGDAASRAHTAAAGPSLPGGAVTGGGGHSVLRSLGSLLPTLHRARLGLGCVM